MDTDNVIRVASSPSELTGKGLEYLAVDGQVIAKFYDGMMTCVALEVNGSEVTKSAA